MPALTDPRQEQFAQHYALNGHTGKAAQDAGFARASGWALANNPAVQARVAEIVGRRFAKASITADRVVMELARIAFSDIRDLYDDNGDLLPPPDLPDDVAAIVSRIKVELKGRYVEGEERSVIAVVDVKLADKMAALTILAKHFKVIGDEADGVNALANILSARLDSARARDLTVPANASDARIIDVEEIVGQRLTYTLEGESAAVEDLAIHEPLTPDGHPDAMSDTLEAPHSAEIPALVNPAGDDDERLW